MSLTQTQTQTQAQPKTVTVTAVEPVKIVGTYKDFDDSLAKFKLNEEKTEQESGKASYPHYLPTWNPEQKYPQLEDFEFEEPGKRADPGFKQLLPEGSQISHLTPGIGSEVTGVQLSTLSDAGKDELALLVAQRKVVAFRNQDFKDLAIKDALAYGSHFGRHHIHPTSGTPEGFPEIHLVYRGASNNEAEKYFANRTHSVAIHSDVSYEKQPPGTTFLYILDKPETGGDTVFVDQAEAYRRLSPAFRERLHGLKAIHSGIEQVEFSRMRGGIVRREPVTTVHPVVRTHPATGEKAIYVNQQFTRDIVGFKKEESDYLLNFLYQHSAFGLDFQARVKWEAGTVVVWDNRVTAHTALVDWHNNQRRHLARITPQAEKPYETPFEGATARDGRQDAAAAASKN